MSVPKGGQVQASEPNRKANIDVPHHASTKPKLVIPKVNLNSAQFIPPQQKAATIPDRFKEPPGKQVLRMDSEYTPTKEFYLDQLVALHELPSRSHDMYLIPEAMNQNRFQSSPLNARGIMQTTCLVDSNLLLTQQLF